MAGRAIRKTSEGYEGVVEIAGQRISKLNFTDDVIL
jgi:hypothetical protein